MINSESYLLYETESRKIIIAPIEVEELKISVRNSYGRYDDSFKISFKNSQDSYDFLNLYEIFDNNSKFIKFDLSLYYNNLRFNFYGSFPISIEEVDGKQIIEINYDHHDSETISEEDYLKIITLNRELKLKSIGIE
jgi:hypothetical protein